MPGRISRPPTPWQQASARYLGLVLLIMRFILSYLFVNLAAESTICALAVCDSRPRPR